MSELNCGDDDFHIDDNSFEEGAGINKITKAYAIVFKSIKEVAAKAEASATAGQTKEFQNCIRILQNKTSQLTDLESLTKPIIGANGIMYNAFGAPIETDASSDDDPNQQDEEPMEEDELVKKINDIVKNNINLSFDDAKQEIENQEAANNITDNGEDHGDIDDVDW